MTTPPTSVPLVRFGVIGCGLMGREFASAVGRWCHLGDIGFRPELVAACDSNPAALEFFRRHVPAARLETDYRRLLDDPAIDAIYCAVPHHLHETLYTQIISAGKHLLGEKPFGIDLAAGRRIVAVCRQHPRVLVRCSSELPFFPGGVRLHQLIREQAFGRILEVESGLWHSSDLNPDKPINWKRQVQFCGAYGCLGDLGMHALHLPLRAGWYPSHVTAHLTKAVSHRPDGKGGRVPCDTWDNGTLLCRVPVAGDAPYDFQMTITTKRIAPGHANTWFCRVYGTKLSVEFSTQFPKTLRVLPYAPGGPQAWHVLDLGWESAYPGITGSIFEFGFSDAILMMWAAFCDELLHGRDGMKQPLYCVTPDEALAQHELFTAALESEADRSTVPLRQRAKVV
ncbi:MAG: Gfo/Idh/MocA family protein [Tepidisphaerales bacterium]